MNCEKQAKKIDMFNIYEDFVQLLCVFNLFFVFIFALEQEHANLLSTMF